MARHRIILVPDGPDEEGWISLKPVDEPAVVVRAGSAGVPRVFTELPPEVDEIVRERLAVFYAATATARDDAAAPRELYGALPRVVATEAYVPSIPPTVPA